MYKEIIVCILVVILIFSMDLLSNNYTKKVFFSINDSLGNLRNEMLKENIIKFNLNPDDFDFYLETFKYGMPPHGGFAIGLERLTMKILKLSNIREAALVPRDMKRLTP